jgi:hypothetical protein
VIDKAALRVQLDGIPSGGTNVVLTARDMSAEQLVKRSPLHGERQLELIFEQSVLAPGAVDLGGVVTDAAGRPLACGAAHAASTGISVVLKLVTTDDNANCGACGRTCDPVPHSSHDCDKTARECGSIVCESGWFDVNGDPSDGCETTCAAPMPENTTVTCKDNADNDCDDKKDCADEGCQGLSRACSVGTCGGMQTWDCTTDTWSTCDTGAPMTRACNFGSCTGSETLDCATGTWSACTADQGQENDVTTCSDTKDNDCDNKADCNDETCAAGFIRSCMVQTCTGSQSWTCSTNSWSTCAVDPGLEHTIAACSDGLDNDCDGKTDCNDPDCLNIQSSCSGSGLNLCAVGVKAWLCNVHLFGLCIPYVSLPENSDLLCGDGLDNDCDAKIDCADNNCTGKHCGGGKVCCANGTCAATCP